MTIPFAILAQETVQSTDTSTVTSFIHRWPHEGDLLAWCQGMTPGVAALLIMVGIVYLLFGFKIFKAVVLLNAAILGGYIGASLAINFNNRPETEVACGLIGAFAAAAVTWPTMKYSVALMGGVFGALLGASIWKTVNLEPQLVWAGALTGLVLFGLLSFVLFRGSVMLYTSLQGAFMLIFGILGLIYKYNDIVPQVNHHLTYQPLLLPVAIFIPATLGWIFQHHSTTPAPSSGKK